MSPIYYFIDLRAANRTLMILVLALLPFISVGQKLERERINLDADWKFSLGHASDPNKDFNFKTTTIFSKSGKSEGTAIHQDFNDSTWRELDLPHDWAVELPFVNVDNFDVMAHGYRPVGGLFPENSIGWYRKHFTINQADSGRRFSITFDGIFRDAMVWINGFYMGNNESGYIGETYDITDYINFGKSNTLVVRVDATQYEGWFYEGAGIYRHVWLNIYNNLHIAKNGVFVYTERDDKTAKVFIETTIQNETQEAASAKFYVYISDRHGKLLSKSEEVTVSFNLNETKTIEQQLVLNNPELWTLEEPYLYKISCVLKSDNEVIDEVKDRFGVRTITIDKEKGMFLNGKHIKIQGVNNHHDHAGLGSALPDYMHYYRVKLLKELGTNAYRTSHNPPTPELLEACDSLGMLVMDETRLLNTSPEYMDQFEKLIKRDRNHPSVFMWSIGNEEGYVQMGSVGKRMALTMLATQKELDPTRTSTYAADVGNVYEGINTVIPIRSFNYREEHMVAYHNDHPDQPVMGTEMGSTVTTRGIYETDSVKGYLPDQDISYQWWASLAEDWWPITADNDWLLGGFIWTGFDYRGEPTPFKWPNISSHFGVMDVCGFPKNIYYYYQSWWTDKDVLHISPHWNWQGREGENIDVWVNSNADEIELFLNKRSLGKKYMTRNSHLQWEVPYEKGTLKAVGLKNGRVIETSVETTGIPHQIVLKPDRRTIKSNGKDATVINIVVVDKRGREVPDTNNLIRFSITGNGNIIGVGNGDPSSHEPDKILTGQYKRSLFNGKCQMILQAGKTPGNIEIIASSDGLKSGKASVLVE